MSIAVNGKETWLGQIWAGGAVDAVYTGDTQVWPDVSGEDGGIMIDTPLAGTWDYLYWLHAVDASETLPATETCYLKFTVEGVDYYLNSAPNGEQVVYLDGSVIKLTKKQKQALAGKLTDTLTLEAVVPVRDKQWKKFQLQNSTTTRFKSTWYLPLLPDTCFVMSVYKGQKREWAYTDIFSVESLRSKTVIELNSNVVAGSKGRYNFENRSRKIQEEEIVLTDSTCTLTYNGYGATGCRDGVTPVWPAFEKTFNINIISIF